ncbi:MAG: glycosyltransferase family 39 protein [Myxococcota bacterium]
MALSAVAFVLIRLPFVSLPLERDEGEYAYIAQQMLQGSVPYLDAFDQKPPGVFAAYAIAFVAFGESIEAIHFFSYLWTAGVALLLFLVVRRLASELPAAFATLAFAVSSSDPKLLGTAANTEHFMLLPMLASAWFLLRSIDRDTWLSWLITGALAAAACWFKQVAVANALFLATYAAIAMWRKKHSPIAALRPLAGLLAGALAVSIPIFAIFAWAGAWGPFLDSVFLHNFDYAQQVPLPRALGVLRAAAVQQAPSQVALWSLAGLSLIWFRKIGAPAWSFLLGWQLACFVGVSFGFYFRPHYFIQQLPSLCALAGITSGSAVGWVMTHRSKPLGWAAVVVMCALLLLPMVYANRRALFADDLGMRSRIIYGNNPFPESLEIAKYIERTSRPEETVYILGSEPQILFYAQRRSATRYIFFYPLIGSSPDALERQRAVSREAEASRPRYVIWVNISSSLLLHSDTTRHVFEAATRMTTSGYGLEFVAFPRGHRNPYEFVYGNRAEREFARVRKLAKGTSWIAVYRRLDAG